MLYYIRVEQKIQIKTASANIFEVLQFNSLNTCTLHLLQFLTWFIYLLNLPTKAIYDEFMESGPMYLNTSYII